MRKIIIGLLVFVTILLTLAGCRNKEMSPRRDSELGTDRASLIAKANGGCNKSATALVEDEIKAVTAMIGTMENKESRRILRLGMILQEWKSNPESTVNGDLLSGKELVDAPGSNESFDRTLNGIKKQLEAQLAQYRESTADSRVEN